MITHIILYKCLPTILGNIAINITHKKEPGPDVQQLPGKVDVRFFLRTCPLYFAWITLWLFNIAMENDPSIHDFPIKTIIYGGFSVAMLNNQMVSYLTFCPIILLAFCSRPMHIIVLFEGFHAPPLAPHGDA